MAWCIHRSPTVAMVAAARAHNLSRKVLEWRLGHRHRLLRGLGRGRPRNGERPVKVADSDAVEEAGREGRAVRLAPALRIGCNGAAA